LNGHQQKEKRNHKLNHAVHKSKILSRNGLLERAFTTMFKGLVYPQIWEDPQIDMEALAITPDCHVVTISSGGCNVLSYLVDDPAKITAVDLNNAHVALTRLKLCAALNLPDYDSFYRFFGKADDKENVKAYDRYLKPHLDAESRQYWEKRNIVGRRRIGLFAGNFYRAGLLGKFIGVGHLLARLYGRDLKSVLNSSSVAEQRSFFDQQIAPLFEKKFIRWMVSKPVSLYGLGIPPAQYAALAASGGGDMALVLRQRLEKLTCDFSLNDNYFAWQAYGRAYGPQDNTQNKGPLPPYLQPQHYEEIREKVSRVDMRHISFTVFLQEKDDNTLDRYLLLDAQDWMNDQDLTELWSEITRTAKPGARVVFRTAAEPSLLPGRIPDELLAKWEYDEEYCLDLTRRDRSAIYGGVHLYVLKG
jgi:S-adenosylmethionine-diacylglycerol 3-amino-3-carboxypropyl transferase